MRSNILLACVVLAVSGCAEEGADYAGSKSDQRVERATVEAEAKSAESGDDRLVLHAFYDNQSGMKTVELPLPASWQVARNRRQGEPIVTGPRGLQIFEFPAQNHMYTNDPQMQQIYYQSGQQLRAMPGVDGFIEQDMKPWAEQQGLRFLGKFDLPDVTRVDQWYHQQLFQAVPTRMEHAAFGTDWETADGSKLFVVTHLAVGNSNNLQTWFHYSTGLQAQPNYYEPAKKQLIFGLANAQYNPEQIQAYNQREAQKAGQSWAAHNQRMRNNQANFEATQRAIVGANDAVSDSIMQGWRDRNAVQDRGHDAYIDSVHDRSTMVESPSGQAWKVDSGANNYWMNNDGEYIATDDYNYDPNVDTGVNNQNWQQLEDR